jgi:hypothetical protein
MVLVAIREHLMKKINPLFLDLLLHKMFTNAPVGPLKIVGTTIENLERGRVSEDTSACK